MRVLSLCTSDSFGGAARAAYRIHDGINRYSGWDSRMFVRYKQTLDDSVLVLTDYLPRNIVFRFFLWILLKLENKYQHLRWKSYKKNDENFLSDLRGTFLNGALRRIDYDVLHLHWINQRFLNINELRRVDKPIVWTLHDSWAFTGLCHIPGNCEKFKNRCSKCPYLNSESIRDLSTICFERKKKIYSNVKLHIVTPSNWLAECVRSSSLLGKFPVYVIPNGLDVDVFRQLHVKMVKMRLGLSLSKKYLLYGAFNAIKDENKGFDLLLASLTSHPLNDVELLVFGDVAENLESLLPIPIRQFGYIKDDERLVMLYNAADVMLVPSRSETFGQTAVEALACGTPVVAFDCTGLMDVVEHKVCGYLAVPYDTDDFYTGINWVLNEADKVALQVSARQRVLQNFSDKAVSLKYAELYNTLV